MTTCGFCNPKGYYFASRQVSCKNQTQKPQSQVQSNNTIRLYIMNNILTQVLWNANTIELEQQQPKKFLTFPSTQSFYLGNNSIKCMLELPCQSV